LGEATLVADTFTSEDIVGFNRPMPFPITQREKVALSVLGLLIVLGLLGMALL
jgi:hypothetical protein